MGVGAVFWLALCAIFLYVIRQDALSDFDPHGSLYTSSMDKNFDFSFKEGLKSELGDLSMSVVHFKNERCWCQTVAQPHIDSVKALAKEKGLKNVSPDGLSEQTMSKLPSLPAVAVFDKDERLVFLGPYSSGISCSPNDGIVEPFIGQKQRRFPVAAVVTDARGCYCNT